MTGDVRPNPKRRDKADKFWAKLEALLDELLPVHEAEAEHDNTDVTPAEHVTQEA